MKNIFKSLLHRFYFWRIVRRGLSISDLHKEKKRLSDLFNDTPTGTWAYYRCRIRIMAIEKHLQDIYNETLVDGKQWPPRDMDGNPII